MFVLRRHSGSKNVFFCPHEADSTCLRELKKVNSCTSIPILCKILAIFLRIFASTTTSVSTPNFQKSTPFENLALTFFSVPMANFRKNKYKYLNYSGLVKPLKNRLFSAKNTLARNFQNLEGVECSFWEHIRNKINRNLETESGWLTAQSLRLGRPVGLKNIRKMIEKILCVCIETPHCGVSTCGN